MQFAGDTPSFFVLDLKEAAGKISNDVGLL
jgi:hypothetical protein